MTGEGAARCLRCAEPFGSAVPFCPFCGAAQQPVAAARPAPPPARPVPVPIPVVPQVVAAERPALPPAPPASAIAPRVPRKPRRWLGWLAGAALLVVAAEVAALRPGPSASLVVHVRSNGVEVTGGEIVVDGVRAGLPGTVLAVKPGTAVVSYERAGWRAEPRTASVGPGGVTVVDLAARELPGRITLVTTPPGAAVASAGRALGRSPVTLELAPGVLDLTVTLAGSLPKVVSVTVVHGDAATIAVELTPAPPRRTEPPFGRGVVTRATGLLAAPVANAEMLAMLDAGTEVSVAGRFGVGPSWLQVRAGSRSGYVAEGGDVEGWDSWAQRNTVSGTIETVTPDLRVMIGGNSYPLGGVQAPGSGNLADVSRVAGVLLGTLRGLAVRCTPRDPGSFACKTAQDWDVAQMYVLNGGALVASGAPPAYGEAQRAARDGRRGVWGP